MQDGAKPATTTPFPSRNVSLMPPPQERSTPRQVLAFSDAASRRPFLLSRSSSLARPGIRIDHVGSSGVEDGFPNRFHSPEQRTVQTDFRGTWTCQARFLHLERIPSEFQTKAFAAHDCAVALRLGLQQPFETTQTRMEDAVLAAETV